MTHPGFTQPVELRCVLDAGKAMRRMIPMLLVMGFAVWLLAALPLGLMFPRSGVPAYAGGITIALLVVGMMYLKKRRELEHTYGHVQKLVLHPGGMRRYDDSIITDMAWNGVVGFDHRNSALPARRTRMSAGNAMAPAANAALSHAHTLVAWGIVGHGTVRPQPGASPKKLRVHDSLAPGSNLTGGMPHSSPQCLIFPGEFEREWTTGVIGAWLRHYRPDLALPQ